MNTQNYYRINPCDYQHRFAELYNEPFLDKILVTDSFYRA
jgi:hypothetical protein